MNFFGFDSIREENVQEKGFKLKTVTGVSNLR